MSNARVDANSLLAIDIGTTTTRAQLFDAVEGRYRFLAAGSATTTIGAPIYDASEGVRLAIDQLQSVTGRVLIDSDEYLVVPSGPDGKGVDVFVATISAGPPLKVFAVGLLDDVSLETARRLLSTTYAEVVGELSLKERRKLEEQIDTILHLRPDLVLVTGGTEDGASQSVMRLIEPVGLACYLMPREQRPDVLFAGNQKLAGEVESTIGKLTTTHFAPNLRPSLDVEQLGPAQQKMVEAFRQIRGRKTQGLEELIAWADGRVFPTATAFGRVIRFLSKVYEPSKGVLGVDIGASSVVVAAAFAGDLSLYVDPQLGIGRNLPNLVKHAEWEDITRWIPFEVTPDELLDYVYNRSVSPSSVPTSSEDLAIDQAFLREMLRTTIVRAMPRFPAGIPGTRPELTPWFEPIVATGGAFTGAPTHGQNLLLLLDAIQPTGVTTVVLDQNQIASSLGAAASANPLLAVQVLESGTFLNLGTVISPVGRARAGTPVIHARLAYETGSDMNVDVRQGSLEVLPLPNGQAGKLHLQPLQRQDIGMGGPGRGGTLRVVGGELGVVIDARGRPLQLARDPGRQRDLMKKWLWTLES